MMIDMVPVELIAATAVAIKFIVDILTRTWNSAPWLKVVCSIAVSYGFCRAWDLDVFAQSRMIDPTMWGYAMSALLLAALASKIVHPSIEGLRGAVKKAKSGFDKD